MNMSILQIRDCGYKYLVLVLAFHDGCFVVYVSVVCCNYERVHRGGKDRKYLASDMGIVKKERAIDRL